MRIETKFDIGDAVCFRVVGGIVQSSVDEITVVVGGSGGVPIARYHTLFDGDNKVIRAEFVLFPTVEGCELDTSPEK